MKVSDLPPDERLAFKQRVKAAIAEHLQLRSEEPWDVLRELAEFAPFIGKEAGPTGARLFFRWLEEVTSPTPADKTRPHEGRAQAESHQAWSKETAKVFVQRGSQLATPRMVMRYGRLLPDLEQKALQSLSDAEALRLLATGHDPASPMGFQILHPKFFTDAHKMGLAALNCLAKLQAQQLELEDRAAVYEALISLIETELKDHPDLQRCVREGFLRIVSSDASGGDPS